MPSRKPITPKESFVDLPFPLEGLDEARRFGLNMRNHTAEAQNVRAFEPATDRARGGSRAGLSKFVAGQVNGDNPIRCLAQIIGGDYNALSALGYLTVGRTSGGSFSFINTSGTAAVTGGAVNYRASAWDVDGFCYVISVSSTTMTVTKYNSAGTQIWTTTRTFGSTAQCGGCGVFQGMLYMHLQHYPLTNNSTILRIDTATGTDIESAWKTLTAWPTTPTGAVRSFAMAGGYAGVINNDSGSYKLYDANTGDTVASFSIASGVETYRITLDPSGNTYLTTQDSGGGLVRKYTIAGVNAWNLTDGGAASHYDAAFDPKSGYLAVVGGKVNNLASKTFATIDVSTGAVVASSFPNSVTWHAVLVDAQGGFRLVRAGSTTNVMGLDEDQVQTFLVSLSNVSSAGVQTGTGCLSMLNQSGVINSDSVTPRSNVGIAVANGTVKAFTRDTGLASVTNGTLALSPDSPLIFATQYNADLYFADGVSQKYYQSSTDSVLPWTLTAGTFPSGTLGDRPRLICTWRARIVLSGIASDSGNWFMSAVNDPMDFDYSPASITPTQAVAGNNSPAGQMADSITCLIPYSDDVLIMGGDHSIWMMAGDPMGGGQIDLVSDTIGMAWGRPFCKAPDGTLYFMSNRAAVYKYTPGQQPVRISQQINHRLSQINIGTSSVRMAWSEQAQALHVFVSPLDVTEETEHYCWEMRTAAWWPDVFSYVYHNPLAVHVFDGDSPDDRVVMLGGRDGYIRFIDNDAEKDDSKVIESNVCLGPLLSTNLDDVLLKDLQAVLATSSNDVSYAVHVGQTPEEALDSDPVVTGSWLAGRNFNTLIRRAGYAIYIKLSSSKRWAMETVRASIAGLGKVRRRG